MACWARSFSFCESIRARPATRRPIITVTTPATNPVRMASVLVSSATNYFPVLLGDKAAKYDFRQWKPLLVNPVGGVLYASPASRIKRVEDLAKTKDLIYGGISAIGLDLIPLITFELLEMDAKGVLGFKGRGEARIAFERGETNLDYQTTPAYTATVVPLINEGKAIPLMSFGQLDDKGNIIRDPAVPDLPTVPEVYEKIKGKKPSGKFWETYKVFMPSAFAVQKILWVKADAPAEASPLRKSFADSCSHCTVRASSSPACSTRTSRRTVESSSESRWRASGSMVVIP
jgi:hypothetical protein